MAGRKVRQYIYTDHKGRPVLRKLRTEPKGFFMDSWCDERTRWVRGIIAPKENAADRAMYHLQEVQWALDVGEPVWWCEGEKDADAIRGVGGVATSHWQGAGHATRGQARWFTRGSGPIYVVVDADRSGCGAACALTRKRLLLDAGVARSRIKLRRAPHPHKDAAAAIEAGKRLGDFRRPDEGAMTRLAGEYATNRRVRREPSDWMGEAS